MFSFVCMVRATKLSGNPNMISLPINGTFKTFSSPLAMFRFQRVFIVVENIFIKIRVVLPVGQI